MRYALPMRTIPQRELRNDVARVLREVDEGESFEVTVDGRPVAQLIPIVRPRRWISGEQLMRILQDAPLDARFQEDVDSVLDQTIDEL
jgi:prevent-host-death family protein